MRSQIKPNLTRKLPGINDPDKITKNLGCEIIKNLTKQLDGHIELFEHEHGTGYKLTFPIYMDHTIEG